MTDPANKTVLVTGAGGGFGGHMVKQFRAAGSRLVLTDVTEQALSPAVGDAAGNLAGTVIADLSSQEGCEAVIEILTALELVPDILVNNAGLAVAGKMHDQPPEQWVKLMQVNLIAPMRLCHGFLPAMIERGSGHIVNISSVAGWLGSEGLSSYCASKFGLRGFGESLSAELADTGVRVTNVYPCFSRTSIINSPQYGYEERRVVPEYLISDPSKVVARIIRGIRRNKLHVFPDWYARPIHYTTRFAPWLMRMLDRLLQKQSIEAGRAKTLDVVD